MYDLLRSSRRWPNSLPARQWGTPQTDWQPPLPCLVQNKMSTPCALTPWPRKRKTPVTCQTSSPIKYQVTAQYRWRRARDRVASRVIHIDPTPMTWADPCAVCLSLAPVVTCGTFSTVFSHGQAVPKCCVHEQGERHLIGSSHQSPGIHPAAQTEIAPTSCTDSSPGA